MQTKTALLRDKLRLKELTRYINSANYWNFGHSPVSRVFDSKIGEAGRLQRIIFEQDPDWLDYFYRAFWENSEYAD